MKISSNKKDIRDITRIKTNGPMGHFFPNFIDLMFKKKTL